MSRIDRRLVLRVDAERVCPFAHYRPAALRGSEGASSYFAGCEIGRRYRYGADRFRSMAERFSRWVGEGKKKGLVFALGMALLIGCDEGSQVDTAAIDTLQAVAQEDGVLVEVGSRAIRVADYKEYMARMPAALHDQFSGEQFLEAMVEEELLVQEGDRRGLGREPALLRAVAREEEQIVQRALYARVGIRPPEVPEEELRERFGQSPYNRQVRFSLLMVRDEAQMPGILAELEAGADFTELSLERSQDPRILERNADMGYHRWGDTMASHAALTEKAFGMEPGELAGPLKVADGYFLIKLTDVHPVSFEQERETIHKLVLREKLGRQLLAYYDTLHAHYAVRYDRAGLELLARSLGPDGLAGDVQTVVATYEGGAITLAGALELLQVLERGQVVGEEALRREVGRQILVPLEVARLGLADDSALRREVERTRRTLLVKRLQEQLQAQAPAPESNALSLFYEEHKARYEIQTQVDVRRALAESEAEGRDLVARYRAGRDTSALTGRFVHVTYGSGALAGDNPVSRALRGELGTMHGPFATDNGYIVLQVLGRREARLPPLAEVREQVEADWSALQIQTAVKGLAADLLQRRADQIRYRPDAAARLALIARGGFDE